MDRRESAPEELARSRDPRLTARRHDRQERYMHFLRLAQRTRLDGGLPAEDLDPLMTVGDQELCALTAQLGGKIFARKRPKTTGSTETCTVYVDECGSHSLRDGGPFKDKNTTGLQLADLLARPCGEKVADPGSTPARWAAFRTKLCPGRQAE